MVAHIIMPKLAMGQTEGTVIEWLVEEGAWVEKGQEVMVIETEKVTYECEAPASGFLHRELDLNVTVPVLETVALLAETEEELAHLGTALKAQARDARIPTGSPAKAAAVTPPAGPTQVQPGRIMISPVAKKWAREHNLDIATISGTGPGGRIVKEDVDRALVDREAVAVPEVVVPGQVVDSRRVRTTIPLQGMRKAIAEHMLRSLAVSAQLSHMGQVDMTELIDLRESLLRKEEEIGVRITYTDLFVLVMAKAIQHVPVVNSSLIGDEIKIWEDANVGVAAALEIDEYQSGLIVPVVKRANEKTLTEISRTVRDLSTRAREGNLTPEDVDGGTITLSNAGQFSAGWSVSTPIINQPESVIVQTGGIFDQPVARDGQVVVRPIMTLNITFDHRVMDGVPIARFYNKIKELIENPAYLHL